MQTKKEIEKVLEDSYKAIDEMEKVHETNDALIYEGWTEALEWVLTTPKKRKEKKK